MKSFARSARPEPAGGGKGGLSTEANRTEAWATESHRSRRPPFVDGGGPEESPQSYGRNWAQRADTNGAQQPGVRVIAVLDHCPADELDHCPAGPCNEGPAASGRLSPSWTISFTPLCVSHIPVTQIRYDWTARANLAVERRRKSGRAECRLPIPTVTLTKLASLAPARPTKLSNEAVRKFGVTAIIHRGRRLGRPRDPSRRSLPVAEQYLISGRGDPIVHWPRPWPRRESARRTAPHGTGAALRKTPVPATVAGLCDQCRINKYGRRP